MHWPLTAVVGLAGTVLLVSCGLVGQGADDATDQRDAKVVALVPEGTASGEGVSAAVESAISETTAGIDGWAVQVETVDARVEGGDEDLAAVAEQIADDDVVAVIGGLSTETVRSVQPVLDADSLLFVSPADTIPEHTRGADVGEPMRPYETYFRTAVSGDDPLYALARYTVGALELDTVAVIDAGGDGEADVFAEAVRETGGEVVRVDERDDTTDDAEENDGGESDEADEREGDPSEDGDAGNEADEEPTDDGDEGEADEGGGEPSEDGDGGDGRDEEAGDEASEAEDGESDEAAAGPAVTKADVVPMLNEARDEGAGAVFVSGSSELAAEVADRIVSLGLDMELLGGPMLSNENFMAEAGSSAEGAWTAVPGELSPTDGARPDELDARMSDVEAEPGQYGAAAYDAGLAVGTVLGRCLPPASTARSAREGCVGEMAELTLQGVTGEVDFDRFGDRAGARPVIMTVRDGTWTSVGEDR